MLYYHTPALRRTTQIFALLCTTSLPLAAETPRVVTDIPPIQSLVAQVMGDLGTPDVIVPASASPHHHSMRPSQAAALDAADAVFWIGPELTPWLDRSLNVLADQAKITSLLKVDGSKTFTFRDDAELTTTHDDHEDHEDAHEDHGDQADHDEDGHKEDDHDEHAHDHVGLDPHAWLDPANAVVWLGTIAAQLSELDPENAGKYTANAASAIADIEQVSKQIKAELAGLGSANFVVFHDAFQYFEKAYDLSIAGTIALSDASQPSPARIAQIKTTLTEKDVVCVFTETQFDGGLVDVVIEGTSVKSATLDPLGVSFEAGASLYTLMLKQISSEIAGCLRR